MDCTVGQIVNVRAWWQKGRTVLCEITEVNEGSRYEKEPAWFVHPYYVVRPLEGGPHMREVNPKDIVS